MAVAAAGTSAAMVEAEDISAVEVLIRAIARALVLTALEAIAAELLRALMEPTEERDPAPTVVGPMAARPIARDTLALMVAGLRRHRQVHVTVQLLTTAQTQRQQPGITALLALTQTAARPQETLRRRPTAEVPRLPGPPAGRSLPIDLALR